MGRHAEPFGDHNFLLVAATQVTNDLPQEFYDGRVRFVLKKGNYRTVKNGLILAEYDCVGEKTAVLVRVDIPAKGTITVNIPTESIQP